MSRGDWVSVVEVGEALLNEVLSECFADNEGYVLFGTSVCCYITESVE